MKILVTGGAFWAGNLKLVWKKESKNYFTITFNSPFLTLLKGQ